jgi:hypothetical protein
VVGVLVVVWRVEDDLRGRLSLNVAWRHGLGHSLIERRRAKNSEAPKVVKKLGDLEVFIDFLKLNYANILIFLF